MIGPTSELRVLTGPPEDPLVAELRVDVFAAESGDIERPWTLGWPAGSRPATDLHALGATLAEHGWPTAVINPRGCDGSTGETGELPVSRLADDVAAVIQALGGDPVFLVGHAFGNRIMRTTATCHPQRVRGVALLAAGGQVPPGHLDDLAIVRDRNSTDEERLGALQRAYFEPTSDPSSWLRTGGRGAAKLYATTQFDVDDWHDAGTANVLIVQGSADRAAPPENGELLVARHPDRFSLVTIDGAAHALAIERPTEVAGYLVEWFRAQLG